LENLAREIAGSGLETPLAIECDVTREDDLERAVSATVTRWGRLDIAVANAGFGVIGALKQLSVQDYRRQFETNVFGALRTIYASLPEIEKSKGNIAIIGSVAGWGATPGASPYCMSKFAVRALANAVRPELALSGVKVTLISPGFVASEIRQIDNQGKLHAERPDPVPAWLVMKTDTAVRQILRAIAKGRHEKIITGHGKILVGIARFAPWMLRAAGKRMALRGGYRQPTSN
jgi:short-subunit dehydrogenase